MIKIFVTTCFFMLWLFVGQGYGEEISKCSSELEYLYNYYYDPSALKLSPQKPSATDSVDTISSDKNSEENKSSTEDSLSVDSTVSAADELKNNISKVQAEVGLKDIETRSSYDLIGFDPLNNASLRFKEGIPYLGVFINYTGDGSDLDALGVIHGPINGEIITVKFPLSILPQITALQTVIMIYDSYKAEYNSINGYESSEMSELDVSIQDIGVDKVHQMGIKGKGVVIGIIDSGIDIFNDDFRNSDGTTRIKYIWDQTDNSGTPLPELFWEGSEYNESQINQILSNSGNAVAIDTTGHGTHVAGIAAGNGRQTALGFPALRVCGRRS